MEVQIVLMQIDPEAQRALERSALIAESRCGNFELRMCRIDGRCNVTLTDKMRGVFTYLPDPKIEEIMVMLRFVGL